MDDQTTITFTKSAKENNHIILTLDTIGANVSRRVGKGGGQERTLWNSYTPPQNTELRIAIPLHPGAGPAPEGTIPLLTVTDIAHHLVVTLEEALDARELSLAENKKEKGW